MFSSWSFSGPHFPHWIEYGDLRSNSQISVFSSTLRKCKPENLKIRTLEGDSALSQKNIMLHFCSFIPPTVFRFER